MPEHLRLMRIVPLIYNKKNSVFRLNMAPKQSQNIDFSIEPLFAGLFQLKL
ncbi:MAG: hypothetical protein ACTSPY_10250 [Candidatus Helarchaeota archaeon]